jgi:hypothetical protein
MSRGRPPQLEDKTRPVKYEVKYENDDSTEIWKYNTKLNPTGPVEVNITYKGNAIKEWGGKLKEAKQQKKTALQMKKINEKSKRK